MIRTKIHQPQTVGYCLRGTHRSWKYFLRTRAVNGRVNVILVSRYSWEFSCIRHGWATNKFILFGGNEVIRSEIL